jgi:predicted nucleotidyltransferase
MSPDFHGLQTHLHPLASIASDLGDYRQTVVFIGGAIAPLLQTHAPFPKVRATKDVDAVAATSSHVQSHGLGIALRALGFRHDPTYQGHAHRWISPSGYAFDLVPAGEHLGATGNEWDEVAIDEATEYPLAPGLVIKHVTAPMFLILKWNAYRDRGHDDPRLSSDVEDFLALLASRPTIMAEIQRGPQRERDYLRECAAALLAHPDCDDALDAHLSTPTSAAAVIASVRKTLQALAT